MTTADNPPELERLRLHNHSDAEVADMRAILREVESPEVMLMPRPHVFQAFLDYKMIVPGWRIALDEAVPREPYTSGSTVVWASRALIEHPFLLQRVFPESDEPDNVQIEDLWTGPGTWMSIVEDELPWSITDYNGEERADRRPFDYEEGMLLRPGETWSVLFSKREDFKEAFPRTTATFVGYCWTDTLTRLVVERFTQYRLFRFQGRLTLHPNDESNLPTMRALQTYLEKRPRFPKE